ncbi:MAG: peptide chain release factor N(5)-glutamine methyltransferase [Lachnospiraceae bacterium]|nr:peptide chain release factor N(5)-glutamine methyltransferase [Lachnospiraceae bacterium]
MTYGEAYQMGYVQLENSEIKEAKLDARLLLEFICDTNRNDLLVHPEREITAEQEIKYFQCIERRATCEPLQYITGEQEFMGLTFLTDPSTLIPRQDTETLVEEVLLHLHDGMEILDVCTGSGCILLSLLKYSNDCIGVGCDLNPDAVLLAKKNAEMLGLDATFVQSDLFEHIEGKYDMIVSNPPYVETAVIETLDMVVKGYEPHTALDGGADGLDFYRRLVTQAKPFLRKEGMLFFEIGYNQAESVSRLLAEAGYIEVTVKKDLAGLDRVVYATYMELTI